MESIRDLVIRFSTDSSSLDAGFAKSTRLGADFHRTMAQGNRQAVAASMGHQRALAAVNAQLVSTRQAALGLGGAFTGIFALGSVVSMADEWGQISSRVKMATDSQSEYIDVQRRLMEISDRTYKNINEQAELYISSASAMKELGYATSSTIDFIDSISSSLTINSASAEKGKSAIDALNKSMVKGKISGQEWNTVLSVTPTIAGDIARHLGTTEIKVKELATSGKLSMKTFADAVIAAKDRNAELAEAMPTTVGDAWVKLNNHLKAYLGEANAASGATRAISGAISALADNIDGVVTVAGVLAGIGVARRINEWSGSMRRAASEAVTAAQSQLTLATAQREGLTVSLAQISAERAFAVTTQQSLLAQLKLAQTEKARAALRRQLASNSAEITRLTKEEAAATAQLAAVQSRLSVTKDLASKVLSVVGGIPGVLMLGAGMWYTHYQSIQQSREEAREYAKQIDEIIEKLPKMTLPQAAESSENLQKSLAEQNRLIDEQLSKIDGLKRNIDELNKARSNPAYKGALNGADLVGTAELEAATAKLAVEQSRLNEQKKEAQRIQNALSETQRRENILVKENAWRQNMAYQSLVMMTGEYGRFNKALSITNGLLASQNALINVPLRLPDDELTDSQKALLQRSARSRVLSALPESQRVVQQAEYDADDAGFAKYSKGRQQFIDDQLTAYNNREKLNDSLKTGSKVQSDTSKAERAAATVAEQYARKIADLSIATEVQKVRAEKGEKAAELYAAAHETGTKWTDEQRKAIEANATELARWTQKADEAVRKQRDMADALKDLRDAARKYQDDATLTVKTAGMGDKAKDRYQEKQEVERVFDKTDSKSLEAIAAHQAALDALERKYQAVDDAEANWLSGISRGMENWVDEASKYSSQAAMATQNAMTGMVDNVADALNGNKSNWRDWAVDVLKSIQKVALNAALVNVLGQKSSGSNTNFMSSAVGWFGSLFDGGGYTGDGGKYDPAGIVHRGEFVFDKESTAYFGHENLYRMMKGRDLGSLIGYSSGGLVGSASPTPVTRPSASYPAVSGGASSVGMLAAPQVNITIQNDGNANSVQAAPGYESFGRDVQRYVDRRFQELVIRETGPGGSLWSPKGGR